ncbi:MAG: glycosyltransferase family 9 protein [Methylotenera sp.]|nr:glycosyltransferase family 9 protein [Methylotenera sp.]
MQDNHLNQALPLITFQVKRILFITLSNIGDAILTTPTLEALHLQYPEAVIDIVCDPRSEIIFKYCPYRGEIFLKHKKVGWCGAFALIRQLRRQHYDIAVDLRSDGLLWLLRAKQRAFKLPNRLSLNLHSVEKHFAAVKTLVMNTSPPMPKIWLSDKEREAANLILGDYREQRILALGIGANFAGKIWPVEHFQALCNELKNQFDVTLLLGGLDDVDLAAAFKLKCELPVLDCCGKTDLLTTAALLEHADYFVGNDSGLGHLASAL